MAKVYEFPVKKSLPDEVKECLYEIGSAYVKTLNYALSELTSDNPTQKELDEIKGLVDLTYAKGICKAIDELEEP